MGTLIIFFIMVTGIALVIDTMLTHTFPAFTIIGFLLLAGCTGMKAYEKHLINKNKFWNK